MVYIPQQQILTRLRRYKALNKTRLQRALSLMHPEARFCLSMVPVLLHYNHINLPGYRQGYIPHGIDLFVPNEEQSRYLHEMILPDSPPLEEPQEHAILGLYAMGSTSSLGQSDSSDVDIWVCVKANISPDGMTALQNKCRFITSYVKAQGVELNLFVTPEDRFTNFTPDSLDEENCGSAQNMFLLDEFYRSSIRLCGRYIIWYLVSTKEEQSDYGAYVDFLLKGVSGLPIDSLQHNREEIEAKGDIAPHVETLSVHPVAHYISPAFSAANAAGSNDSDVDENADVEHPAPAFVAAAAVGVPQPVHHAEPVATATPVATVTPVLAVTPVSAAAAVSAAAKQRNNSSARPVSVVDDADRAESHQVTTSAFSVPAVRTNALAESGMVQGSLCSQLSPSDFATVAGLNYVPHWRHEDLSNRSFYSAVEPHVHAVRAKTAHAETAAKTTVTAVAAEAAPVVSAVPLSVPSSAPAQEPQASAVQATATATTATTSVSSPQAVSVSAVEALPSAVATLPTVVEALPVASNGFLPNLSWEEGAKQCPMLALSLYTIRCLENMQVQSKGTEHFVEGKVSPESAAVAQATARAKKRAEILMASTVKALAEVVALEGQQQAMANASHIASTSTSASTNPSMDESRGDELSIAPVATVVADSADSESGATASTVDVVEANGVDSAAIDDILGPNDKKQISGVHILQAARSLLKNSSFRQYFPYLLATNSSTLPKVSKEASLAQAAVVAAGATSHGQSVMITDAQLLPKTTMVLPSPQNTNTGGIGNIDSIGSVGSATSAETSVTITSSTSSQLGMDVTLHVPATVLQAVDGTDGVATVDPMPEMFLKPHVSSSTWEWWDRGDLSPEHYGDNDESYFERHASEINGPAASDLGHAAPEHANIVTNVLVYADGSNSNLSWRSVHHGHKVWHVQQQTGIVGLSGGWRQEQEALLTEEPSADLEHGTGTSNSNNDNLASSAHTAPESEVEETAYPEWANGNVLSAEESLLAAQHDGWEEYKAPLQADEWFDFGSVVKSSPTEYFGSGLWLLYKAIDSPFKVVLKILLMEAYSNDYPQTKLLSSELKEYMHSHDGYSLDLDSYYLMYLKVSNYLQELQEQTKAQIQAQAKAKLPADTVATAAALTGAGAGVAAGGEGEMQAVHYDRLNLMRKCFYLKIFKGLNYKNAYYRDDYQLKRGLLDKFAKRWGWSSAFVKELESISSWKVQAVYEFNQEVYNTLLESYMALLRFSVRHGIEYAITSDDAGVLSRKLYAAFDRYPSKIPLKHTSLQHDLEERHLTFIHPSEYSLCRQGWHLYTAAPSDVALLNTKVSYIGARLSEVVTWACFNELLTARSHTYVVGDAPRAISNKIKQLSRDIQRVLGPKLVSANEQALQEAQKMRACVIVLNLEQDDTELLQKNLLDIGYGSTLCCGRQRICLVGSIDLVFINSWGELRSVAFPNGEEGVVELLATLLRIMSNSADEHESAISLLSKVEVCSYAESYQDLLKYDLEAIIRQVFNCLSEGSSSEFVFEVGRNTYIARAQGERGVVIQRNGVFGSNEFDISVLSRYGMRPEFALQVPPIVDRYASAGIVQYFFVPLQQHGHWDIYILNERNEVRIYNDYYGSRASLVNAINRFYTSQSQNRALYATRFNLPQYFVLSNDQKSLHPFTIKTI